MLADIVVPTAGYFLLHAAGISNFWALTVAGATACLLALVNTVRRRQFDGVGFLVLLQVALSVGLLHA
jgi:hypothetical protein